MSQPKDFEALSFAVELALKRHEEEQKRIDLLNSRAFNLIGYAAALGGLYFGTTGQNIACNAVLLVLSLTVFFIDLAVIVLCLWASNVFFRNWYATGPGWELLVKDGSSLTAQELKESMLRTYGEAYGTNYDRNMKTANLLRIASALFALGFVIGFVGFISVFFKFI